jgi:hypothetical protein
VPYLRLPLVSGLFATEDRERALSHNDPNRLSHLSQAPEAGAAPRAASKGALLGAAVRDVLRPMLAARLSKCPVLQSVVQSRPALLMALPNGTSCLCGPARTSRRPVPMLWQ